MSAPPIDTVRLQRYARAYCETAVLYAALDLALFTHVDAGADTEARLASAMDVSPLQAERLVACVLAMGLVELVDGRLRNAPDADRFLVKGRPGYAADWLTFTRANVPDWFRLTDLLVRAEPPTTLGMYEHLTVDDARRYHAATFSIGAGAARRFVRRVDLSRRRLLLDLGGGSGAYSIAATKTWPQLRAIVLDLPPVTVVTQEYIDRAGAGDRVSTLPGDFTKTPFPEGVDAAVMASNLPIYDEDVIRGVVRRVHDALVPGGEFHLVGEMLHDDRRGPLDAALWGMNEAVCGSRGKAHTIAQCLAYFRDAGFTGVSAEEFIPDVLHRVSGVKAG